MKFFQLLVVLSCLSFTQLIGRDRLVWRIPDINGYKIVKCDFHSHTVFSDGHVWPTFRVGEAWADGLDALAITDHIEYQPNEKDVSTDHNRSYELAKGAAQSAGILLIKGAEITRDMPPGHFNALFLQDAAPLDVEDWRQAFDAAHEQGAFIFRNHPGWRGQEKDGIGKWYDEHEELYQAGKMHGIEVVNDDEYYPEVHQWCLDKKLTMLGNSDIHSTTDMEFNQSEPKHRPMTWVLAT
ncbi:histidinol-phosphatase, partial [candidate division KSB1 bacterium]